MPSIRNHHKPSTPTQKYKNKIKIGKEGDPRDKNHTICCLSGLNFQIFTEKNNYRRKHLETQKYEIFYKRKISYSAIYRVLV